MSVATKNEISNAVQNLSVELLNDSLNAVNNTKVHVKKLVIINKFQETVESIGIKEFITSLGEAQIKDSSTAVGLKQYSIKDLENAIKKIGLDEFLIRCDIELLTKFCENMGLSSVPSKKEMEHQLADEVVLSGMKAFLTKLNVALLKKFCKEFNLKTSGTKAQFVESIMVHIFELEPLNGGETSSNQSPISPSSPSSSSSTTSSSSSNNNSNDNKKSNSSNSTHNKTNKGTNNYQISPKESLPRTMKTKISTEKISPEKPDLSKKVDKKIKLPQKETSSSSPPSSPIVARGGPRPPITTIKQGMTYTQLYDTFNATDLVDYCRKQGLKITGKKPQVIKRIISFLETGNVEVDRKSGKKKRRRINDKKKKN